MAKRRLWWRLSQRGLDARRVVFIDETGASTKMARRYGRAMRGKRLIAKVPHAHWKTTTFIGGLRLTGFTAPLVIDGPMNGQLFLAYVQQQLAPTLQNGAVVVMDNLAAHKVKGVRQAIEAVGARVVYLPPYSPDFNPIELAFAKLKAFLRAARPRTFDQVVELLAIALQLFTPRECLNFVRHCGYRVTTAL